MRRLGYLLTSVKKGEMNLVPYIPIVFSHGWGNIHLPRADMSDKTEPPEKRGKAMLTQF